MKFKMILLLNLLLMNLSCLLASMINNGCKAYDCHRHCINQEISKTPGDNGFKFEIDANVKDKYIPEKTYTITLSGSRNVARNTFTEFRGFLIVVVPETWYDAMPFFPMGQFKISPNDREIRYTTGCREIITHANFEPKSSVTFHWTAPKAGSGCVSLKAHVIQTETLWFKDDGALTKTLCESDEVAESSEIPTCCACGEAKYQLSFKGTWKKMTFPKDWPNNEWLTHWSNIIGATHMPNYTLWQYGGYASAGLKDLAEYGIIRTLEEEIKNHSRFNVIRNVVTANGLWFPNINNITTTMFTVSNSHHLLSFATMLGPSPDWLSGISKLNLCLPNCTWAESYMEDLFLFDAGTDSGLSYNSPNRPSDPQEKIRKITNTYPNSPQSPFYDPANKFKTPFAKLSIKRQALKGMQCPNGKKTENNDINNGFSDTQDLSDINIRNRILDSSVSVKKGKKKTLNIKFIEFSDPNCMTTDWSEWSKCSSKCGNGLRKRTRHYKDPLKARGNCNDMIEDNEMCLSENGECDEYQNETLMETSELCLMVSTWTDWSPCSVSCGVGFTIRYREYVKEGLNEKCKTKLTDKKSCMVTERCLDENLMSFSDIKRICMQEKKIGPCRMNINNTRYYYDWTMKKCLQFEYGGCRGNQNNFLTHTHCEKICGFMNNKTENSESEIPLITKPKKQEPENLDKLKKMCLQASDEGLCHESQIKYYFDRTKLMCVPFEYTGCGGNNNNFNSITECESNCHPVIEYVSISEKNTMNVMELTIPEKKKICMSPAEKGTCSGSVQRYAYNVNMAKCLIFEYSGCEGNLNNFENIQDCEKTCDILIQMARQAAVSDELASLEAQKKEMCMLPKEKGPCMEYITRYYFDTTIGKCTQFTYGSCHGNENNFETLVECEETCHSLINAALSAKQMSMNMEPKELSFQERKTLCKQAINPGTGSMQLKRFFFNFYTQTCEPFIYTGSDGNENNFLTIEKCIQVCSNLNKNFTAEAIMMSNKKDFGEMLPQNCLISDWTKWSNCTATECGKKGFSIRSRQIYLNAKYGGEECPKNLNEKRICYKKCNRLSKETSNCIVGKWSNWSECKPTVNCKDGGYQERYRKIIKESKLGSQECPNLVEKRKCFLGTGC